MSITDPELSGRGTMGPQSTGSGGGYGTVPRNKAYAPIREGLDFSDQEARYAETHDAYRRQLADLQGYRDVLSAIPRLGMQEMSRDAGRAFAAAMGQAGGMPVGGGSAAMLRQQGLDTGRAKAGFLAETLPAIGLARSEAAQQQMQAMQDWAAGRGDALAHAYNQIETIRDERLAGEEGQVQRNMAITQLLTMAQTATDPAVRQAYLNEADRIARYSGVDMPIGAMPGVD